MSKDEKSYVPQKCQIIEELERKPKSKQSDQFQYVILLPLLFLNLFV